MKQDKENIVTIIGAGLAGSEAAWQISRRGIKVRLIEMRPKKLTPAHKTGLFAELVCSNSLRSRELNSAVGLLKEEMKLLGSLIIDTALSSQVPAGKSLAVDREKFSSTITKRLKKEKLIEIEYNEVTSLPSTLSIIATGPLTSEPLAKRLSAITGQENLHFYDAIAPIVYGDTINMKKAFFGSRWQINRNDYLNCPLTEEEYKIFYKELIKAEKVPLKTFEEAKYFEGCLPIEVMAERGEQTLLFGPMKPVGLIDPKTGKQPFAVVQLRREDHEGRLFNMVGFQTKMTYTAQKKVFRLIPALERAEFARLGSIHRNTFVCAPEVLKPTLQLKRAPHILLAGQISGVEGYVESTAMGLLAGIFTILIIRNMEIFLPPKTTAIGGLLAYLTESNPKLFQPMNINFGLIAPLEKKLPRKKRREKIVERAIKDIKSWVRELSLPSI